MAINHYTITGLREAAGNRGLVPFEFGTDADTEEEAMGLCSQAFASWDASSGNAICTPAVFADVHVRLDSQHSPPIATDGDATPAADPEAGEHVESEDAVQ